MKAKYQQKEKQSGDTDWSPRHCYVITLIPNPGPRCVGNEGLVTRFRDIKSNPTEGLVTTFRDIKSNQTLDMNMQVMRMMMSTSY